MADAFDEVQRAEQDEDRFVEEANQYANQKLGQARGEAAQIREDAAAYKNRVVQEAEGEAQRFISVYNEYVKAPDVTRKRLFLETMEQVLEDSNKVIVRPETGRASSPICRCLRCNPAAPAQAPATREQTDEQPSSLHRRSSRSSSSILVYSSIYVVNEREQAIVLRFGEITDVKTEPGIYFKVPIPFVEADNVQIIEDRLLRFDIDNMRVQVSGGKFYEVDAFVTYRIIDRQDVPRSGFGQHAARRRRGCAPASTLHCAGSTACATSTRRCRRSARR